MSNGFSDILASELYENIAGAVKGSSYWEDYFRRARSIDDLHTGIHLGIFVEPFLGFILKGRKTVESRFSTHRIAPYGRVQSGDIILLKKSGGPIVGLCEISDVWSYHLDPKSWRDIKADFARALCAQDPTFWSQRRHASFATLMRIHRVLSIDPIGLSKRDRRAWVILQGGNGHGILRQ